ncbi:MAG: hypothetical protein ABIO46_11770 [Chitinophagales bacterium]
MSTLTESEFLVLDELYFVTSYQEILQEVRMDENSLRSTLISLLEKGFVVQLKYNESMKDFEKLEKPDLPILQHSSYVASRQGLLIHNSRN